MIESVLETRAERRDVHEGAASRDEFRPSTVVRSELAPSVRVRATAVRYPEWDGISFNLEYARTDLPNLGVVVDNHTGVLDVERFAWDDNAGIWVQAGSSSVFKSNLSSGPVDGRCTSRQSEGEIGSFYCHLRLVVAAEYSVLRRQVNVESYSWSLDWSLYLRYECREWLDRRVGCVLSEHLSASHPNATSPRG